MSDSISPSQIGPYEVVRELGRGGMGIVFLARDPELERRVALKVLPEAFAGDPERLARYEREAKILASLQHPNIAGILSIEQADGLRFITMEYNEGETLLERLGRGMSIEEALEVCSQIASALEAAHESGVIHRDLKPANVWLASDGRVKVLDFGLARAGASSAVSTLTQSPTITSATEPGMLLGTAAYMSPEQARGTLMDRRSDIWSFGCVLYECLTRRSAFAGQTVSDTIARILEREPDLDALAAGTPDRVRELLRRCLEKDPRRRMRDIGEVRVVLEDVLATRSSSGRLPPPLPMLQSAGRRGRRRALWATGFVALAISLLSLASFSGLFDKVIPEPRAVSIEMPPDLEVMNGEVTRDGRSLLVTARARRASGDTPAPTHVYVRRLDGFEFEQVPGTEGARWAGALLDNRTMALTLPVSPGSSQSRFMRMPIDGSAPPTAITDWKQNWTGGCELPHGDFVMLDGPTTFVRFSASGQPLAASTHIDAGERNVSDVQLHDALPDRHGVLVGIGFFDDRGWHASVGVLDPITGKVKVVVNDGDNPSYSRTGHLLFARGDAVFATRFDLGRLETRGPAVAVWRGSNGQGSADPARFSVTTDGSFVYRPAPGGGREVALLESPDRLVPLSSERWNIDQECELSPDARQFACAIVNARGIKEIWISDLAHATFRRLQTESNADCSWQLWSPDGNRIAYTRVARDGRDGLYAQDVRGTGASKRLLQWNAPSVQYSPSVWLQDGSALILTRWEPNHGSLWLLPAGLEAADSTSLRPLLPGPYSRYSPRVSKVGHLLAFISDESGRPEAYVTELHPDGSTGPLLQVSTAGSLISRWAPDAPNLYIEDMQGRIMRTTITRRRNLEASSLVRVFDSHELRINSWCALPNGRFLVTRMTESEGEITRFDLVLNWTKGLEHRMRAKNQ